MCPFWRGKEMQCEPMSSTCKCGIYEESASLNTGTSPSWSASQEIRVLITNIQCPHLCWEDFMVFRLSYTSATSGKRNINSACPSDQFFQNPESKTLKVCKALHVIPMITVVWKTIVNIIHSQVTLKETMQSLTNFCLKLNSPSITLHTPNCLGQYFRTD